MKLFVSLIILCSLLKGRKVYSQTIGGNAAFNFLNLPASAQLSALGGTNISNQASDVSLAYQNPALLRDSMNSQVATDFNLMYSGIKNYFMAVAYHNKKLYSNFSLAINFIDYGTNSLTDAAGNISGNFSAFDYFVQISMSGKYKRNWYYGAAVKFITSSYGQFKSNGIALDMGLNFLDNSGLWQIGFVAKNMGTQLKSYASMKEDIPFDLELGISKKIAVIPFQFSFTAHHLHQFDIRFNDTLLQNSSSSPNSLDKVFRHFIFAAQYSINKVELTVGYNHLRRNELKISSAGNGLNGFSLGIGAIFSKIQMHYARAYYQNNSAYNQLGINFSLRRTDF